MKYFLVAAILMGCSSNPEKTMLFECNEQNQGEACFMLGKRRAGEESLAFYRRGRELENVNSCGELLGQAAEGEKARKSLQTFCDRGNKNACGKLQ